MLFKKQLKVKIDSWDWLGIGQACVWGELITMAPPP